ncbi:MAG TPA: IreB family regulatory phosphoprotein [Thermaerobacter sp.]
MGPDRMPAADAEPTMYGGAAPLPGEPAGEAGEAPPDAAAILAAVYEALEERGYDPVRQLAGYLLSGDPAYITSHRGARALVARVERDQLLTELVRTYVAGLRGRALRHERKA